MAVKAIDGRSQMRLDVGQPESRRYSMLELISCAEREVKLRKQVYPRRVQDGRITRALAERETAMMVQIAELLRKQAGAEGWAV